MPKKVFFMLMTSSMTSQGDLKVALYIHVLLQGQCLVNTREYRNRLSIS